MATQSATIARSHEATHVNNAHQGRRIGKGTVYVILTVLAILWIIPMLWAVDTAFKPETETTAIPVSWLPTHFTLQAFTEVLQAGDLPRWYLNSILTSVVITVLTVLLASMAAFAFSRIYWQIWMPLSQPAIAAVAIFAFVASWNNFVWPFIAITSTEMMTLPVGLATVQTSYGIHYAQIMATAVLGGLPTLIAFLFFQRLIVQGFAGTGLKE